MVTEGVKEQQQQQQQQQPGEIAEGGRAGWLLSYNIDLRPPGQSKDQTTLEVRH